MTEMDAEPDTVTAALIVIGEEILSGRTKDENIAYIAGYLDQNRHRCCGRCGWFADCEAAIVAAVNELRARYRLCVHHRRHRPDP